MGNALTKPGQAQLLGSPVDLSSIKTDAYVLAGVADHLCDWESCYRTTQLLGGDTRFVLSTSGHVAAIVNPPGNPQANYQVSEQNPKDPAEFVKDGAACQRHLVERLRRVAAGATTTPRTRTH